MREGPTYTQVVVGERGAHVVELAARLGGGHDAELCAAALDVDLNALALAAALGEPVDAERLRPSSAAGGACVRFLVPEPGMLEQVAGVEEARSDRRGRLGADLPRARRGARPAAPWLRPRRRGAGGRRDSREEAVERAGRAADCVRFVTADAAKLSSRARDLSRIPAARGRRRGGRGGHRRDPVGLADDRSARRGARAAVRRVRRREARARRLLGDGRDAPRARRARDRAGRRGDHDADHLAGDRERDRPHGCDARSSRTFATPT